MAYIVITKGGEMSAKIDTATMLQILECGKGNWEFITLDSGKTVRIYRITDKEGFTWGISNTGWVKPFEIYVMFQKGYYIVSEKELMG